MKKSNTELMKELKELQTLINYAQSREDRTCVVTYNENDRDVVESEYDYETTRNHLATLQKEERNIKKLLAMSNATTIVDGFDMTIAEALVYLAQLSQNKARMTRLASREKLTRERTYNGWTEYSKACYDIKKAQDDLGAINREIAKLQIAIDKTNLTNDIEY